MVFTQEKLTALAEHIKTKKIDIPLKYTQCNIGSLVNGQLWVSIDDLPECFTEKSICIMFKAYITIYGINVIDFMINDDKINITESRKNQISNLFHYSNRGTTPLTTLNIVSILNNICEPISLSKSKIQLLEEEVEKLREENEKLKKSLIAVQKHCKTVTSIYDESICNKHLSTHEKSKI